MSRVRVDLELNKNSFDRGLHSAKEGLNELKGFIAAAFTVDAIASAIEKTIEYADTIDKTSLRMKLTTEQVQTLGIVAEEAGSNLETIEAAFRKIELARAKALGGDNKLKEAFTKLGVDSSGLHGSIIEIAAKVSSAGANGSNAVQGVALQDLGLKAAAGDLTAIGDALGRLNAKTAELKEQGAIISDEDIANIVEMKDEWELLEKQVMSGIAPILSWLFDSLEKYFVMFKAYWSNLFATIMTLATTTINYYENLWRHLLSGGKDGKTFQGIRDAATKEVGTDLKAGIQGITDDVNNGLEALQKNKEERDAKRKALRTDKPDADKLGDVTSKPKSFTDSLTGGGNFLGASFGNAGAVATSLDIQKRQAASTDTLVRLTTEMLPLFTRIAENTIPRQTPSTDWN